MLKEIQKEVEDLRIKVYAGQSLEDTGKALYEIEQMLFKAMDKQLNIPIVSFELPSDDIFDMPEVDLKNPLEEFYYYERPPYLKSDQKDFKERLQKALNYLKGN